MKRLLMVLVGVAALACLASMASAGDYHVGRLLVCSDCHIAHGSQKHGYATDADTTWLGAHTTNPPYPYLLRGETVSNACLNCHDGKGATIPDVLGATDAPPADGRSAGALSVPNAGAHGYANVAPYSQGNGHTLWSTDAPPGAVGAAPVSADGLQCSDCHRVHGAKYFRNMMGDVTTSTATYIPAVWRGTEVTYVIGAGNLATPNTTAWVLEKTAANYDNDNVQYLEPDNTKSMYGQWCGTCHGEFHGNLTAANIEVNGEVVRHPTAGVDITTQNGAWKNTDSKHRVKLMDNTATWDGTSAAMSPSCFSCHKSHGNANKFGLIFVIPFNQTTPTANPVGSTVDPRLAAPTRLANMTEEGDGGQYRDLCRNCHGMGNFPTGNPTNLQ